MRTPIQLALAVAILVCASPSESNAQGKLGLRYLTPDNLDQFTDDNTWRIHLAAGIMKGDYEAFERECGFAVYMGLPLEVRIDAAGGNSEEAMKMGRFLRLMLAKIRVVGKEGPLSRTRCSGAAVLVLVGAPLREYGLGYVEGNDKFFPNVALHHPYWSEMLSANTDQERADLERLSDDVRDYLREMGAPQEFTERMFRATTIETTDYVPEAALLKIVKEQEAKGNKKQFIPDFVSREKSIEDYLPNVEPFVKESVLASCPETLTEEEFEDYANDASSESYRQFLSSKYDAYVACESEKLVQHQKETYRKLLEAKGVNFEKRMEELKSEFNELMKKSFGE